MSNLTVTTNQGEDATIPSGIANLLENSAAIQSAAASAAQGMGKSASVLAEDESTPSPTLQPSTSAPSLSSPKISASSAMILLMGLQTKAGNESVEIGLTNSEIHQDEVAKQNEIRMNDSLDYFETMNRQEDVNGAMNIANVIISALFLLVSIAGTAVATVTTGGLATAAGVAACVASAAALANSIVSLPSVQENMDPDVAKGLSIGLMVTSLVATVVSVCLGIGAVKVAASAGTKIAAMGMRISTQAINTTIQATTTTVEVATVGINLTKGGISLKAASIQKDVSELTAENEETQADIDATYSSLDTIMNSFAGMVQSTAEMIQKTTEGRKSAASVTA